MTEESPRNLFIYLIALTWLSENKVDDETAEKILPIVERAFEFAQELGRLIAKVKLGLKNSEEVNALRVEFHRFCNEIREVFKKDPHVLEILNKLFEETNGVFEERLLSMFS